MKWHANWPQLRLGSARVRDLDILLACTKRETKSQSALAFARFGVPCEDLKQCLAAGLLKTPELAFALLTHIFDFDAQRIFSGDSAHAALETHTVWLGIAVAFAS
ncbi:hypothetical protein ARC23_16505 [Stenotrophomonas beteli]|uniref:Uncharacterized protein n=1 Tax=Stenotrophomonas beteli TaxID=3384461 RepID=A0A0R0B5X5_9GAMM|nr:hypothetical protein ARC23_16505 [Stenotrophomonas maltophilia]